MTLPSKTPINAFNPYITSLSLFYSILFTYFIYYTIYLFYSITYLGSFLGTILLFRYLVLHLLL